MRLQVRRLAAVLLTMRLAVLPAEAAAPLKLLEKGVSKEALAGLVRRMESDRFITVEVLSAQGAAGFPRVLCSAGLAGALGSF